MIKAEIVADSLSPQGDRLVSVLCTFPRIILAEVNTHRMLSKNTASSRAIPFKKMLESVNTNPFIPIAWQEDHKGMQGIKYFEAENDIKWAEQQWRIAVAQAAINASDLNTSGITKQLCNRLLEPFMWTTMLITGSLEQGWDNFFNLRCPNYQIDNVFGSFKSWKDLIVDIKRVGCTSEVVEFYENHNTIERLKLNKGAAEIHMMALAECIWDAFNESIPKQLKAGEWHIPFHKVITPMVIEHFKDIHHEGDSSDMDEMEVKISTSMAARTSYTIIGEEKEVSIDKQVQLHDNLVAQQPPHSSPMEHCALCMTDIERHQFVKGEIKATSTVPIDSITLHANGTHSAFGWCRNFRGFIPYRHIIETNNNV